MREVSQLLFALAGLSGVVALLLFMSARDNLEVLGLAVASLLQSIVYAVFAFIIRRGSVTALWIAGALFALDSLLILTQPIGSGVGGALFARVFLIAFLVRYVRRERLTE
ncbi:MAG TPA: hypothetical protein VF074_18085 [Pyrinomonadaceae bacterium]